MPADRRAPRAPKGDLTRWTAMLAYLRSQVGRTVGGVTESGALGNLIREEGTGAYPGLRYVLADDGTNTATALTTEDIASESQGKTVGGLRRTITPELFGAVGGFDPAYANTLWGTPAWATYLSSKNDSEAFQRCFQYIGVNPTLIFTLLISGDHLLGPVPGATQRALGRQIYGPNTSLYDTSSATTRVIYERMPVVAEGLKNLTIEGRNCRLYMGEISAQAGATGPDTLMAFYQCEGIRFTGTGRMRGFTPKAAATIDTENAALLRFGIGTKRFRVGEGWHLGAFSGDGVNIGGARTSGGSDDPAHAAYDGLGIPMTKPNAPGLNGIWMKVLACCWATSGRTSRR